MTKKKLASQERENFLKRRRRNQILLFELFSLWNLALYITSWEEKAREYQTVSQMAVMAVDERDQ